MASPTGKNSVFGTCRLCLTEKVHLSHSHIIPEFAYEPCYDEKGRMIAVRLKAKVMDTYIQKGIREHLLCAKCEGLFSKWEGHAASIFESGRIDLTVRDADGWTPVQADYGLFKLYTMSLIWRMGISSDSCFKVVRLGAKHEERLRSALLRSDPLCPDEYPVIICSVRIGEEWMPEWVVPPYPGKFHGVHVYAPVIGGFLHNFFVGSHPIHRQLKPLILQADGTFRIPRRDVEGVPFLLKLVEEVRDRDRGHQ
jgi:hypothetical protein